MTSLTTGEAEPNAARISPRSRSTWRASEQTEITIAFRGPTFMNVCGARAGSTRTETISSSGSSAFFFTPRRNSASGSDALAPDAGDLHLGVLDEQRRQRVAGRRGGAEVAADRAAVADLRRADGARRLGQRGQRLGDGAVHRLRVGEAGAEDERAVLPAEAAQLAHLVEVDQRRRPRAVEVELDEDVGAALDEPGVGQLRLEAQRLVEAMRACGRPSAFLSHERYSERARRAEAPLRDARRDDHEHDDGHHVGQRLEQLGRDRDARAPGA